MCSFEKKIFSSFSMFGNVLTLQTAHGNFLKLCQMVLLPNINFLISKKNKTTKIDQKRLSSKLVLVLLDIRCILHKETEIWN